MNPLSGPQYLFRGFELLRLPGIRLFVALPLLINTIIFGTLSYLAFDYFSHWINQLVAWLPDWLDFLQWLLWPLAVILVLAVVMYLFSTIANIIAAPFNGLLAEKLEEHLCGVEVEARETLVQALASFPRSIGRECRKLLYYAGFAIITLIASFIISPLAPLLWFAMNAWMMAIVAGTTICCRKIIAEDIYPLITEHKVTHFGGAPIVLSMLVNAPDDVIKTPDHTVNIMTAGAPPPAAILERIERLGFNVTQVYGLTETYGHVTHCAWNEDWDDLDFSEKAAIKAQQGVNFTHTEALEVFDQNTGQPVPHDGQSMGEIMFKSNCIMKGYHKNPEATEEALANGYFKSGDLGVRHPNGYIEIKDRLKDIIISGGENISSVEVESVLYRFPGVAYAAVVAKPDEKWGETPCAFLEMKSGETATEADVIAFCREHLAGFKCPKQVVFTEIPKTSTGKLQKFMLRAQLV